MVYEGMEELIEDSCKVQNKENNLLEDYPEKDIPVVSLSERIYSKLESFTVSDDPYQEVCKLLVKFPLHPFNIIASLFLRVI